MLFLFQILTWRGVFDIYVTTRYAKLTSSATYKFTMRTVTSRHGIHILLKFKVGGFYDNKVDGNRFWYRAYLGFLEAFLTDVKCRGQDFFLLPVVNGKILHASKRRQGPQFSPAQVRSWVIIQLYFIFLYAVPKALSFTCHFLPKMFLFSLRFDLNARSIKHSL